MLNNYLDLHFLLLILVAVFSPLPCAAPRDVTGFLYLLQSVHLLVHQNPSPVSKVIALSPRMACGHAEAGVPGEVQLLSAACEKGHGRIEFHPGPGDFCVISPGSGSEGRLENAAK